MELLCRLGGEGLGVGWAEGGDVVGCGGKGWERLLEGVRGHAAVGEMEMRKCGLTSWLEAGWMELLVGAGMFVER